MVVEQIFVPFNEYILAKNQSEADKQPVQKQMMNIANEVRAEIKPQKKVEEAKVPATTNPSKPVAV